MMYAQGKNRSELNLKPSSISERIENNKVIRKIEYCYPINEVGYEGTEQYFGTSIFKINLSKLSPRKQYEILGHTSKGNVRNHRRPTKESSRPQSPKYIVNYG